MESNVRGDEKLMTRFDGTDSLTKLLTQRTKSVTNQLPRIDSAAALKTTFGLQDLTLRSKENVRAFLNDFERIAPVIMPQFQKNNSGFQLSIANPFFEAQRASRELNERLRELSKAW